MTSVAQLKTHTAKELAAMARQEGVSNWHSLRKDELVRILARRFKASGAKKCVGGKSVGIPVAKPVGSNGSAKCGFNGHACTGENGQNGHANGHAGKAAPNGKAAQNGNAGTNGKKAGKAPAVARPAPLLHKTPSPQAQRRLHQIKARLAQTKDVSGNGSNGNGNGNGSEPKDRLVVMVRDPYWLHAYWELRRQSVERRPGSPGPGLARRPARVAAGRSHAGRDDQHSAACSATWKSTAA